MTGAQEHKHPRKWINYMSILFCVASFAVLLSYYNSLPDQVAIHFSSDGTADNFAGKGKLWLIPALQTLLVGTFLLARRMKPENINYPVKINEGNKKIQHELLLFTLSWTGLIISFYFFLIFWQTLELAVGHLDSLDPIIILFMIGSIFGLFIWYFIKARKHK